MKRRKGSLFQRMLAVLLAAVLVTGMVSNAAPASVLAEERYAAESVSGNDVESVSGNDMELAEEETEPEEEMDPEVQEPDAGTEEETSQPDVGTEEKTPGTGTEEETEQETASENTAADGENGNLQALLERIAVLPDAEEYLAAEPDTDSGEADEDAYEQWMSGLYAYAQEVLAIQEAIEGLSEEEQAGIPEEALAKLTAWAEIAEQAAESSMVMTVDARGTFGSELKLHWEFDSASGTLTISGDGEMGDLSGFSDWAPYNDSIRKVVINSGVKDIGKNAFRVHCRNLAEVSIPDTVKKIGEGAFYQCTSLSSVIIPNTVEEIGKDAFMMSGLTDITIPGSVKNVPENLFDACTSLARVTIENGVETIGNATFRRCGKLTEVTIPGSVTSIGAGAFMDCSDLTDIIIPGSVTNIGDMAFIRCSRLARVTIENGVETIGNHAFQQCEKLTEVTIPGSVTSIGMLAFWSCISLKDVTFKGTDTIPTLDFNIFYSCPCVENDAKGLYIPSHEYLDKYLEKNGWSQYERYIDAPHILNYSASGVVITQTCSISGCDLSATAELSTDNAEYAYTGNEIKPAKITCDSNWMGEKPEDVNIVYQNNTNPGTATAQLTIGGATAELTFTIVALPYAVTVQNGEGSGIYKAGDSVTITANAPASGMQFDKWVVNSGSVTLADSTDSTTTFIMLAEAVSVTATYKDNTGGGSDSDSSDNGGDNGGGSNNNSDPGSGDSDSSNNNNNNGGDSNNNSDSSSDHSGGNDNGKDSNHNDGSDNSGTVTLDRAPATVIATQPEELENAALTETEKQQKADEASAVVYQDTSADAGKPNSEKDNGPKTGDNTPLELYATLAMISGLAYLLLYFTDRERGMTEETKRELVSRLIGWAKQGGKLKKCLALAAVFVLLVYYHSIGKKMCAEWKAIYGE